MAVAVELNTSLPTLLRLLLEKEILTPDQLEGVNEARLKDHCSLEAVLVKKGLVMEQHIAEVYADYLMVPLFDMVPSEVDAKLAGFLPEKLCREHFCVPVELHGDTLDVAFATFDDMLMVDELQLLTSLNIRPMIGPLSIVDDAIEALYPRDRAPSSSGTSRAMRRKIRTTTDEPGFEDKQNDEILDIDEPPPPGPDGRIVRMVNQVLATSVADRGERHSPRTVRGFLRHSPARGRRATTT